MADSAAEAVAYVSELTSSTWTALTGPYANLHGLPRNLADSAQQAWDRVTQGGTLPTLPEWTVPAPPPLVVVRRGLVRRVADGVYEHRLASAALLVSVGGSLVYLYTPRATLRRLARPAKSFVPLLLLPTSARPTRIVHSATKQEIRKEALLLLGASTPVLIDLALDLERRGFVVIATVAHPSEVEPLERRSRGWIKVLVLDPEVGASVGPFLRSFETALSLRFPLNTAGDPFSRPNHSLNLMGVVNCLTIPSVGLGMGLVPVEAVEMDQVRRALGERIVTIVGVLKGVMPILRMVAERPSTEECLVLNLVQSTNTLSLPFQSLASASDAALLSLLQSFRRELARSNSCSKIRISVLEVGFFTSPFTAPSATAQGATATPRSTERVLSMNVRLSSIYAPALARRKYLVTGHRDGTLPIEGGALVGRRGTSGKVLNQEVFNMIIYARGGTRSRIGAGATTYHLTSLLPDFLVDAFLSMQDTLLSLMFAHQARRGLGSSPTPSAAPTSAARPPLPTPPTAPARSAANSSVASLIGKVDPASPFLTPDTSTSDEESGESSTEEIDDLLAHSIHSTQSAQSGSAGSVEGVPQPAAGLDASGAFSFVGSEADWRAQ